jgi:hypothetical protein
MKGSRGAMRAFLGVFRGEMGDGGGMRGRVEGAMLLTL